jgi:hypothetical protein
MSCLVLLHCMLTSGWLAAALPRLIEHCLLQQRLRLLRTRLAARFDLSSRLLWTAP